LYSKKIIPKLKWARKGLCPPYMAFLMRKVGKKRTLPTLHGFFNEEGGQEKDFAHPTWLHGFFNEEGGQEKDFAHPTWLF
jgi:hypothetical protein